MPGRCWIHCLDCGERELVPKKWLDRRGTRCRACGGPIEASQEARDNLDAARNTTGPVAIGTLKPLGPGHSASHRIRKNL